MLEMCWRKHLERKQGREPEKAGENLEIVVAGWSPVK